MNAKKMAISIASVYLIIYSFLRNWIPTSNITYFILGCIIFVGVFALGYWGGDKLSKKIDIPLLVGLLVILVCFNVFELTAYNPIHADVIPRHSFPAVLWIGIVVLGTLLCSFLFYRSKAEEPEKGRKIFRIIITIIFSMAIAVQFYAPNILEDMRGNIYHSHAYTNSIINVCWLIPYSHNLTSYYGHYALFYMPFLKAFHSIFGLDYLTGIFIVTAVIAMFTVLLLGWILNHFAKKGLIYYLALFAIGEEYFMLMKGGVYLQVHPHRIIFPTLLVAWTIVEQFHRKKIGIVENSIAIILLTMSFTWSTEVGLVTMMAFVIYRCLVDLWKDKPLFVRDFSCVIKNFVLFFLIPFACAFAIVNLYNVAVGGAVIDLKEFMYPVISDKDYVSNIQLEIPAGIRAWTLTGSLFLSVALVVLLNAFVKKPVATVAYDKRKQIILFFASVSGLGLMLYYINRPVENCMAITLYLALIVITAIIEICDHMTEVGKTFKERWKSDKLIIGLQICSMMILFIMTFEGFYSLPSAYKTASETIWDRKKLEEFTNQIANNVSPEAAAFGTGVPELMSFIDRDFNVHTAEFSIGNMQLDVMEQVRYELEQYEYIFCNAQSLWEMQTYYPGLTDLYTFWDEYNYNEYQFVLYKRIEE